MAGQQVSLPVVDVAPLLGDESGRTAVADAIAAACTESGFFYVSGHGIPEALGERLERLSREFFAWPLEEKLALHMQFGGPAWRGYFGLGDELTLGRPDHKEGLYFGNELPASDTRVAAGVPLHGANQFPNIPEFRETVLDYIDHVTRLGHDLMAGIALSLGLEAEYFHERYTHDPLILFRIFHYPALPSSSAGALWSVGEHTDYGILTILRQDETGGLQVRSGTEWIDARPIPGTLVCNIGDMLDRMTGGRYRSTAHRVRNPGRSSRLSFPLFFDPGFDVSVQPIDPQATVEDDAHARWDQTNVRQTGGRYGDYVVNKVSKVFPELAQELFAREQPPDAGRRG
ncbi:MAG: 2-oxoglutarate and iron-dependent oxygenase domain-containing protein [Planctomycetaceae bacterium]